MERKAARREKKKKEAERAIIEQNKTADNGTTKIPAFAMPLMAYDSDFSDSDEEDYGWMEDFPTFVRAKKTWKKLAKLVLDIRKNIPIR